MKISMETLMTLIPQEADRTRIVDLARSYRTARHDGVLDDVMQELDRHWRAIRRPRPTRDEVAEMLTEDKSLAAPLELDE